MINRIGSFFVFGLILFSFVYPSIGQNAPVNPDLFSSGFAIHYGLGSYSIKDKFISEQKYSGNLPFLGIIWERVHETYCYQMNIAYREADIKNYNVVTQITQLVINQGFLYPLKPLALFDRELFWKIGPATELYLLVNNPDFAISGFEYTLSMAALISFGFSIEMVYPFRSTFDLESGLNLTGLSLGFRSIDDEEDDDQSSVKPLTLFSGVNSSFRLGVRYHFSNHLWLAMHYRFEYSRIHSWEPMLSASDNLVIGLAYRF